MSATQIMLWQAGIAMLLTLIPGSASGQPLEATKAVFYVSPAGNDQWSGRLPAAGAQHQDGPFATPAARHV
jgi:hypothetical protein